MNATGLFHRRWMLGAMLVALQVVAIVYGIQADPENEVAALVPLVAMAPIAAIGVLVSPAAVLLVAPLLVVIPGPILTIFFFQWLLLAALMTAGLRAAVGGSRWPMPSGLEVAWLAYGVCGLISVTQAVGLKEALGGYSRIVLAGLSFLAGYRVLSGVHAGRLVRVMAGVAVVVALHLLVAILLNGYSMSLLASRIAIVLDLGWGRSNYVAAVAALAAGSAIALLFYGRGTDRWLGMIGLLAAIMVQVVTLSRGGTVALLSGLALAVLVEARRRVGPVFLLAGALALAYAISPLGRATAMRFVGAEGLPSVGIRLLYYREAFAIWRDHWLIGAGPDQIPFHTPLYMDANPHNIILKNMADLGVVGLLGYLTLLGLVARQAIRGRRLAGNRESRLIALALGLTFFIAVVNAQVEPTLGGDVYGFLFWITVGSLAQFLQAMPPPPELDAA